MNLSLISYLGLLVASGIIAWGGITIVSHYRRQRQQTPHIPDSWIIIRPTGSDAQESTEQEDILNAHLDAHLYARLQGRYSRKPS